MSFHLRDRFVGGRNGFLRGNFALGPDGASGEVFLFPDGNGTLQRVNCITASVESGTAVRGADGDEYAGFANLEAAKPMDDREAMNLKFGANLRANFAHFSERHGLISFVFEIERLLPTKIVAHESVEHYKGAVFRSFQRIDDFGRANRIAHQLEIV